MGNGPKRKESDSPVMQIAGSTSGAGKPSQSLICPVSVQVKLKQTPLTIEGIAVQLRPAGKSFEVLIGATVIGIIKGTIAQTIISCSHIGFSYIKGTIITEKQNVYARFFRKD